MMLKSFLFLCSVLVADKVLLNKTSLKERQKFIILAAAVIVVVAVVAFFGFRYISGLKNKNNNLEQENNRLTMLFENLEQKNYFENLIKTYCEIENFEKHNICKEIIAKISWIPKMDYTNQLHLYDFLALLLVSNSNFADDEKEEFVSAFKDKLNYKEFGCDKRLDLYILYSNDYLVLIKEGEDVPNKNDCFGLPFCWQENGETFICYLNFITTNL